MHEKLQRFQIRFGGMKIVVLTLIIVVLMASSALAWFSTQKDSKAVQVAVNPVLPAATIHARINQAKESWMQGDAAAFAALFTAEGEFIVPGDRRIGPTAIRQAVTDFAANASNVKIEIRRVLIAGNQALVEWYWEDTEKTTGKRNRADDAIVIDFTGDRISRWREYIDTQTPAKESS